MSDVYLMRTSHQTGKVVITEHVVWDQDRFLASQQAEQRKLREDEKDYSVITLATQADYRAFAWPTKEKAR